MKNKSNGGLAALVVLLCIVAVAALLIVMPEFLSQGRQVNANRALENETGSVNLDGNAADGENGSAAETEATSPRGGSDGGKTGGEESRAEVNELDVSETVRIKIDYPNTGYAELDKVIAQYAEDVKASFLDEVKGKKPERDDFYFDLNMNYETVERSNLMFAHIMSYQFTGGANYERKDESFIFDTEQKKILSVADLLEAPRGLPELADLAREYVLNHYREKEAVYNEDIIAGGTAPTPDNFRHISLQEDGMEITFPPYYVGSRADGEIRILIPYERLKGIVKQEYTKIEKREEVTAETPKERDISQFKRKPLIALTFDDGPNNEATKGLVDALNQYNAKATFFVLGSRAAKHAEALKYAYENGNQIGSHTYNHLNLLKVDMSTLEREIQATDEEIAKVTGEVPSLIRPPYGNTNDEINRIFGKSVILWNVDTKDWKTQNRAAVRNAVMSGARDGAIILLHEIYQTSIDGCMDAVKELSQQGYAFVTIGEMAELREVQLQPGQKYDEIR